MIAKRVRAKVKTLTTATLVVGLLARACNDAEGEPEPEFGVVVVT